MTQEKVRSYSHQIVEFLKGKEIGYEFTARSLHEDIITTPGERMIPDVDKVSATLTRLRRLGAIESKAARNSGGAPIYNHILIAPESMNSRFASGRGGSRGERNYKRDLTPQPDLLTEAAAATGMEPEEQPGVDTGASYTQQGNAPDDCPDPIQAEVRYHLREAFKAYKKRILHPLPEIAVKSIPTDILLAELSKRVKE